jgi:hypothetical protein
MLGLLLLFLAQLFCPVYHAGPAVHHVQETFWLPLLISVFVGLTDRVAVLLLVRLLGAFFGVPAVGVRKNQGRTASYPSAASQIPACGTTAPGSSNLLTYALTIRYSPQ